MVLRNLEGVKQKNIFELSIYCYYERFLNDFIQNKTVRIHQTSEQNFFTIFYSIFLANYVPKIIVFAVTVKTALL